MKLKFSDYQGPTGLYVATGNEILPLDSPAGALAFLGAGLQAGTNDRNQSERIQAIIDKGMQAVRGGREKPCPEICPQLSNSVSNSAELLGRNRA